MSIPILCTRCGAPVEASDKEVCPKCGLKQSTLVIEPRRPGYIRIRGARGREWEKATGIRVFPVLHVAPELTSYFNQDVSVFWLDLSRINAVQLARIQAYLVTKFNRPLSLVKMESETTGIPILAEDCEVNP